MSVLHSGSKVLQPTEADIQKMLACKVQQGTKNLTAAMERYVSARRKDGIHVINLHMTWEKLILAARIIATIENPADIVVISARPFGQRAVLKYAKYTEATSMAGRFCPGSFTNQKQEKFSQPRLIIVTDPRTDHQAIRESAYVNIPIIAFCDTDSPLTHVDVAIPCNNRGTQAISMMYWLLSREVLRMRGKIVRSIEWEEKVDLFFYRDPDEVLKKEAEDKEAAAEATAVTTSGVEADADVNWGDEDEGWN